MRLCDSAQCTGCAACYASCAFDAIHMEEDSVGVLKPEIDFAKCKDCGRCEKACPVLHESQMAFPIRCFALYTKNEGDAATCSSGGIATVFGRYVIQNGGIVYGVDYDSSDSLIYKFAETEEQLESFKGSKYVYAFTDNIYRHVQKELNNGRLCLFVGLPCQVDGLKHFLAQNYDNLMTVDLICHGTPPMKYLKEYIWMLPIGHNFKRIHATFRGAEDFTFRVTDASGHLLYTKSASEDMYYTAFLKSLTYREICYSCPYAQNMRVSDITVGDYWGLEQGALNGYSGKVSVALLNTEKGNKLFEWIKPFVQYEERDIEEAIDGNAQLRRPSKCHPDRSEFLKFYAQFGFTGALKQTSVVRQVYKQVVRNRILRPYRFIKRCFSKIKVL